MNTTPQANKWLTIDDAADSLSCSRSHIERMIKAGKLQCQDIGLGRHKILRVLLPEAEPMATGVKARRRKYVPQILK